MLGKHAYIMQNASAYLSSANLFLAAKVGNEGLHTNNVMPPQKIWGHMHVVYECIARSISFVNVLFKKIKILKFMYYFWN